MAREIFIEGVQFMEDGEEEFFAEGVQISENQAAAAGLGIDEMLSAMQKFPSHYRLPPAVPVAY